MSVSCDNHITFITVPLQVPCEHEELRRDLKQRNIEVSEEQEDGTHTYYLYAGSKAMIGGPGAILVHVMQLCQPRTQPSQPPASEKKL